MRTALLLFSLFVVGSLAAQSAPADTIGQWRSYQSYRFGTYVTESPQSIIYTTGKAIFYLDKDDLSITRLAREDGLDQARIRLIRYHEPTETLIIVYDNSVIDLLSRGRFSTLRQIDNFNFSGDKQIYDLFFGPDNLVYLAAGYGVSALDLNDETFPFTTFTGVRVGSVARHRGRLYAATDEGLYRVPATGVNLVDFNNWELLGPEQDLPGDYTAPAANVYGDQLYFGVDKDVYRLNDTTDRATLFYDADDDRDYRLAYLSPGPEFLLAGYRCTGSSCNDRQLIFLDQTGQRRRVFAQCIIRTNYALEDDRGRIWFGEDDSAPRIRYLDGIDDGDCNEIEYDGPLTDANNRLLHDGESLWVASGVVNDNFGAGVDYRGVYRFREGDWTVLNRNNTAAFTGRDGVRGANDDDFAAATAVHRNPVTDTYWFGSFYEGAIRYDDATGEAELFDETNSSLRLAPAAGPGRVRVLDIESDATGNTYFANQLTSDGNYLSVVTPGGEWMALGAGCGPNEAVLVAVDQQGYVWTGHATSAGSGLTVIDPAGTPLDPADDRCRIITANNSNLPTNNVRSIAVDLRGAVWVGTDNGIVIFDCGVNLFAAGECAGRTPVVEDIDGNGFLLETESIRAIAVDGGNRKWVGTTGGVYLLSPNGVDQLAFFDQGNSPLLDNVIYDIAIDGATGTVFFGTGLGIVSFRGTATAARERRFASDLTIFPNPVEPDYRGPVSIAGLSRDARVKITDLSGKLVAEGVATGGQFIWEGTDYNGRRVTSGVYLVLASVNGEFGLTNPQSAVGKIVFLR